jgi:hypothetical protein
LIRHAAETDVKREFSTRSSDAPLVEAALTQVAA